jgi:5-methylcytosine-specific restriction endonuclease McrA
MTACTICAWPIIERASVIDAGGTFVCKQKKCFAAYKTREHSGVNHPRYQPPVKFNCAHCGKENERPRVFVEGRANPCCDNVCRRAFQKSGKVKQVPANSFMLTDGAVATADKVAAMVADKKSGKTICDELGITKGALVACLKHHNLKIERNLSPKTGKDSPKWVGEVACACHHCGTVRMRKPYDIKGKERVYCDEKCQHEYLKTLKGPLSGRYIEPNKLTCHGCGVVYDEPKSLHPGEKSKFHNRKCYTAWAKKQFGPLHHRWVGIGKYRGDNWIMQRFAAAQRDKGICQLCNKKVGLNKVDVHHIRPFKYFAKERNFEDANALSNLVCFCKSCHMEVEGRTDAATIDTWREHYEINRLYPRKATGQLVRKNQRMVLDLYAKGVTKASIHRQTKLSRAVINACIDGPRKRRMSTPK